MKNTPQQRKRISMMRLRWAVAGLVLATAFVLAVITTPSAQAQTLTTLHTFASTDGAVPYAGLVQATDGDFYGTTGSGGINGDGTVFKITPSGTLTTLRDFGSADGKSWAGLVQGASGNFYGTTLSGGVSGDGTVFKITRGGTLTTLHSFNGADGSVPGTSLIQAIDGNFYGTTSAGGASGDGTVFKITPNGTITTLYSFSGTDGSAPYSALFLASNGNFYGTTNSGGVNGNGTVFRITGNGTLTTLHSFDGTDGGAPWGGLVQAANGNFYGTTASGGAHGDGTVFKITPNGTLTTIYSFCSQNSCADGDLPYAGLIQATNGNFYGTTYLGGANGNGTVFKITPTGTLTTIYSFCSQTRCIDGGWPFAGLVQATNGDFYSATTQGGASYGTVFSLTLGLGPFLKLQSASGKEGVKIGVLGQGFNSSSVVKFAGVAADTITVIGSTYISATVAAGALTGSVTVTTGATTLSCPQTFKVLPTITGFTPSSGTVGTPVTVTGTGLTQAAKITFGGVPAISFTVSSDTQVNADVPAGAKTGKIAVTTKGGTTTSKTNFILN
jgi:uncharacterized repeat protein (TIGR03803 family)